MGQYRKKPVVVEARQLPFGPSSNDTQQVNYEIASWIAGHGNDQEGDFPEYGSNYIEIETLEGTMHASPGDFIIKGVQGEFYPCKPDVFAATYEEVSN
jgi:hypothetical protein